MHQLLKENQNNVVAIKLFGQLRKLDYAHLLPLLEERISQYRKVNLYWEMENVSAWEPGGIWHDLKFDVRHANDFERIAIVGEKGWEGWMTWLMKPFTNAKVKYFDLSQRSQALQWVQTSF